MAPDFDSIIRDKVLYLQRLVEVRAFVDRAICGSRVLAKNQTSALTGLDGNSLPVVGVRKHWTIRSCRFFDAHHRQLPVEILGIEDDVGIGGRLHADEDR